MNYPLQLRFKLLALAPQIYVEDSGGATVCYVKQKLLRFREKVEVFTDATRTQQLCTIAADRIIDFNAHYKFQTPDGRTLGSVRRRGMKSLWKASYEVLNDSGEVLYEIKEQNAFVKVLDGLLGQIPVVGLFTGFFLNPRYAITRGEQVILDVTKHRSFLESRFSIHQTIPVSAEDELRLMLSLLMFVLLERDRG